MSLFSQFVVITLNAVCQKTRSIFEDNVQILESESNSSTIRMYVCVYTDTLCVCVFTSDTPNSVD